MLRAKLDITSPSWSTYPVPEEIKNNYISLLLTNTPTPGASGTFEIKDQIIACGYTHKYHNRKWQGLCKTLKKSEFNISTLSSEVWFSSADGIEVQILDVDDKITKTYRIFNGRWR